MVISYGYSRYQGEGVIMKVFFIITFVLFVIAACNTFLQKQEEESCELRKQQIMDSIKLTDEELNCKIIMGWREDR